jgi:hypothetical protein
MDFGRLPPSHEPVAEFATKGNLSSGFFFNQFAAGTAEELFDEVGGVNTAAEVRILHDGLLESRGGLDAGDDEFAQGAVHAVNGFAPVFALDDDFADQVGGMV